MASRRVDGHDVGAEVARATDHADVGVPVPGQEPGDEVLELIAGHPVGRRDLRVEEPLARLGCPVTRSPRAEQHHESGQHDSPAEREQRPPLFHEAPRGTRCAGDHHPHHQDCEDPGVVVVPASAYARLLGPSARQPEHLGATVLE